LKKVIITIDGPAASGKGRIAKYISKKWKLQHLDSGILYRQIALKIYETGTNFNSINEIKEIISKNEFLSFRKNKNLRKENIGKIASKIAVFKVIRNYINKFQRNFVSQNVRNNGFVVDGRDIGSVVFKKADLKLYIEVNEINRAKRRYKQLIDSGEKSIYPKILKEIKLRDKKDKERKNSPLVIPKDAFIINNNGSFRETVNQVNDLIKKL